MSNTITSNSPNVQTVIYTVTPTSNPAGCVGTPQIVTITVNPKPTMTSIASKTICSGSNVGITLTSNNASTYTWVATNNPNVSGESTIMQTGSTINNILINNANSDQTVNYTVTPTSSPQGCPGASQTVAITVRRIPTMTSTNIKLICNGGTVNISLQSNVPSTYTWVATNNPNTIGESTTIQNGSPLTNTITNNTTTNQTVLYTVT